jgi:hypothetical protein
MNWRGKRIKNVLEGIINFCLSLDGWMDKRFFQLLVDFFYWVVIFVWDVVLKGGLMDVLLRVREGERWMFIWGNFLFELFLRWDVLKIKNEV